jgi:hypothetical protein
MNILFIIEVKKSVLIKTPQLCLTIEPTMIFKLVVSFQHMSLISVLGVPPNHIPLNYKYPDKKRNRIKVIHLRWT